MQRIASYISRLSILIITLVLATSCDDSLSSTLELHQVNVIIDQDPESGVPVNELYTFKNIATGRISEFRPGQTISLITGMYDVSYEAESTLDNGAKSIMRGSTQSIVINSDTEITIHTFCVAANDDLIISEIFFAGTLQPSGNSYTGDDYIKLYNNTDHTIYADGITIFESQFLTTEKRNYTPDIISEAVTVDALYTIPGSGHDYPVEPGECLLIADTGIDHRVANPNSLNLAHADFEWYDVSTTPSTMDIDGPDVTNLDKWYCYTQSIFMMHNRGFKAYGIARIPVDRDTYLSDYRYSFDYEVVSLAGTFPMSGTAYKMPNEWIVDMVNLSIESRYAWNVCAPAIDSGWAYCGTIDKDKTRYFRAVRRKLLYVTEDGIAVLKDTNNSTSDFNHQVLPSEIELQHSAINAQGDKANTITYDGVTPVQQ